jgi:hypothetical protein
MNKLLQNNWLYVAGALAGAIGGYLYWYYVGCASGTCAITSKPLNSSLYFAVVGSIAFGMLKKEKRKPENESSNPN